MEQVNLVTQVKSIYTQLSAAFCGADQVPIRVFGMALGGHAINSSKFAGTDTTDVVSLALSVLEELWPGMSDLDYDRTKAELTEGFEEAHDHLNNETANQLVKEVFDRLTEAFGAPEQVTDTIFGAALAGQVNAEKILGVRHAVILNAAVTMLENYWEPLTGYDETSSRKELTDSFNSNLEIID